MEEKNLQNHLFYNNHNRFNMKSASFLILIMIVILLGGGCASPQYLNDVKFKNFDNDQAYEFIRGETKKLSWEDMKIFGSNFPDEGVIDSIYSYRVYTTPNVKTLFQEFYYCNDFSLDKCYKIHHSVLTFPENRRASPESMWGARSQFRTNRSGLYVMEIIAENYAQRIDYYKKIFVIN
jgi:hypothetical protein